MASLTQQQAERKARLARMRLREEDFEETFSRSSGPGGQNVNKVSTAVTVRHCPTGAAVTAQDSRSQATNRQLAWDRLLDTIERTRREAREQLRAEREKERRRSAPRPWGLKQKILQNKKKRSQVKKMRSKSWD